MRTSTEILETLARAIARTPGLYWLGPIPPAPYRRPAAPRDEQQRP